MSTAVIDLDEIIRSLDERAAKHDLPPSGLSYNPFPVTGISTSEAYPMPPLDNETLQVVREFLIAAVSSQKFTGMAVLGDFGLGKSHLLRWLDHVINTTSAKVRDRSVRAYYISNPGLRPMEILMAVTKAIGEEDFRKMIWAIVAEDLRKRHKEEGIEGLRAALEIRDRVPMFGDAEDALLALLHADTLASFGKFRERYTAAFLPLSGLRSYVSRVLRKVTENRDVVQALCSLLLDEEPKAFTSWVSLTSMEGRQQLKVPQQDYFEAIFGILSQNGFGPVFLLVDEFEDVVGMRLNPRQRAEYLATLRLLIDARVDDFSLVVAMVPQAWELTRSIHPPFADRVGGRQVNLLPLNAERAELLVKAYLSQARPDGDRDQLRPFTPSAIRALVKFSEGNVRAFTNGCYRVLQHYWDAETIDDKAVQTVVSA